jgi:hypothetical protein
MLAALQGSPDAQPVLLIIWTKVSLNSAITLQLFQWRARRLNRRRSGRFTTTARTFFSPMPIPNGIKASIRTKSPSAMFRGAAENSWFELMVLL